MSNPSLAAAHSNPYNITMTPIFIRSTELNLEVFGLVRIADGRGAAAASHKGLGSGGARRGGGTRGEAEAGDGAGTSPHSGSFTASAASTCSIKVTEYWY